MSDETRQNVNPSSDKFQEGVEAGLNSAEDTTNWHAGNELGQELKGESVKCEPEGEALVKESSTSLFVPDVPKNYKGNLQDEKDETAE